jgi:hypothetical protein
VCAWVCARACVCAWVCVPCCVASVGWRAARACIRPRALPHTTVPASAARCRGLRGVLQVLFGPSALGLADPRATRSIQRATACNTQHTTCNSVQHAAYNVQQRATRQERVAGAGHGSASAVSSLSCISPSKATGRRSPTFLPGAPALLVVPLGRPIEHRSTNSTPHIIAALLRHGCVAIRFRLARHAETAGVRASRAVIQSVIDTCLGGGSADALG